MLSAGCIDYFPVSLPEIFEAFDACVTKHNITNVAIETDLVFQYKFDIFFFVNKNNESLRKAIEDGLNKAYEDGSYLQTFNQDPGVIKAKNNLASRRVFKLDNPGISAENTALPAKYWE